MKITLSQSEVKASVDSWLLTQPHYMKSAIEAWMTAQGYKVSDSDTFTLNPDGTVEIDMAPVATPVPTPTDGTSGHLVTVDPPLSVTGQATMFGLNWDGSVDASDNGQGFFGYNTRNKALSGVSLPREVLLSSFLKIDSWVSEGIDSVWSKNGSTLRQWVDGNKPMLTLDSGGKSVTDQPLVDAGPSAETGNSIDLTYATAHALGTGGKALCTYMILVAGKPVEIRGWNSKIGKVGL